MKKGTKETRQQGPKDERETGKTYCLAAKIMFAFLSLRLASRFSGVSSQMALPPPPISTSTPDSVGYGVDEDKGSEEGKGEREGGGRGEEATRAWRLYRDMSVSLGFVAVDDPVEEEDGVVVVLVELGSGAGVRG